MSIRPRFATVSPRIRNEACTLIEVLISVIVLSIGMLGFVALHTVTLRNNHDSYLRSQAILLTQDIIDRIRANKPTPVVANPGWLYAKACKNSNRNTDPGYDCHTVFKPGSTTCSIDEMVRVDVYQWTQALKQTLPGGVGVVCPDSQADLDHPTPDNDQCDPDSDPDAVETAVYAIKIWWDENRDGITDAADPVFVSSFQP